MRELRRVVSPRLFSTVPAMRRSFSTLPRAHSGEMFYLQEFQRNKDCFIQAVPFKEREKYVDLFKSLVSGERHTLLGISDREAEKFLDCSFEFAYFTQYNYQAGVAPNVDDVISSVYWLYAQWQFDSVLDSRVVNESGCIDEAWLNICRDIIKNSWFSGCEKKEDKLCLQLEDWADNNEKLNLLPEVRRSNVVDIGRVLAYLHKRFSASIVDSIGHGALDYLWLYTNDYLSGVRDDIMHLKKSKLVYKGISFDQLESELSQRASASGLYAILSVIVAQRVVRDGGFA